MPIRHAMQRPCKQLHRGVVPREVWGGDRPLSPDARSPVMAVPREPGALGTCLLPSSSGTADRELQVAAHRCTGHRSSIRGTPIFLESSGPQPSLFLGPLGSPRQPSL